MNILLIHNLIKVGEQVTFGAVEYYRMQKPMEVLSRMFPEFQYATLDYIENVGDEFLQDFDIILFARKIINPVATSERLNKLGIVFGLDLDDYWHLPTDHILYEHYDKNKIPALITKSIHVACFVICTTEILANKIRPLNDNVYIIENGIDTDEWRPNKIKSDRLRFGFTQGTTHIPDIELINKDVARSLYDNKFYHKAQIVLCGFNAEHRQESIYIGYEKMLTDDLKPLKFHSKYVYELKILHTPDGTDKPYKRIWTKDISDFHTVYDEIDITVAPLKDSEFNKCKSNIKMLESGFKDCAVMVSAVSPYSPLATKENSFLLSEKSFFEWQRYILNNPLVIEDKKAALKEMIEPYSLQNLTNKRREVYESCVGVLR